MTKLEKAYFTLQQMEMRSAASPPVVDARVNVIVSLVYLGVMLSVPMGRLSMLLWFALVPIISAAWLGIGFGRIFRKSLYVVPLVLLIGMFNPIYDRTPAFTVGGITVSTGWLSFISIVVRGLLAMQCILILIESCGFLGICRALRRIGVPAFLTDQLQFVYRYMSVLLLEALSMRRAREARGFGRKSYPIRLWGVMTGQLFLRAVERSERINRAMLARGFNGTLPCYRSDRRALSASDIIYLILILSGIAALRIFDLSTLFARFM